MTEHILMTCPEALVALLDGRQTAELRPEDRDKPFAVNDVILLREWDEKYQNPPVRAKSPRIHTEGYEGTLLRRALDLDACTRCGAGATKPCRTVEGKIAEPHRWRDAVGWNALAEKYNFTTPVKPGRFTGAEVRVVITHVLHGPAFYVPQGYCLMSIRKVEGP